MTSIPDRYSVGPVTVSPNVVLAPMEGVTDICFRRMVRAIGGVGLTCTEFVASKGLREGKSKRQWEMAAFDDDERPVAVQIYGSSPSEMADAARLVEAHGATIVDVNMGCPSKKVCRNSGGSALMADPNGAIAIVRAVRAAITVPLTVKMRSGFSADDRNAPELAWRVQEEGADAVAIHWRTREDRYGGERTVDKIAEAVDRLRIPVVANGDILDVASAAAMFADTGCAGVMVGRGAVKNPWLLKQISQWIRGEPIVDPSTADRLRVLLGFVDAITERFRKPKGVLMRTKMVTRRFTDDMPSARDIRDRVLRSKTPEEARELLRGWLTELEEATPASPASSGSPEGASSSAPSSGWRQESRSSAPSALCR